MFGALAPGGPAVAATVPGVPTGVSAVAGDQSTMVSWTGPVSDGGSAVTGYTVTLLPGSRTCSTTVGVTPNPLTCTVTGLVNGTAYSVYVVASNVVGDGPGGPPASLYSIGSTGPAGGLIFYDAGSQQSWGRYLEAAPPGWGGAGYFGGGDPALWTFCDQTSTLVGASGTVIGTGAANTAKFVSGCSSGVARTAAAYSGGGKSDWFVPSRDELTQFYTNRASMSISPNCGYWSSSEVSATQVWDRTFTNGVENQYGKSSQDCIRPVRYVDGVVPAATVTPDVVPGAPTSVVAVRGNASASLSWSAPVANGGTSITSYAVTSSPVGGSCLVSGLTASCAGLTNGTAYTFTVKAHNAAGDSAGGVSNAVTPATVPDVPTGVSAVAGDGSAVVSWLAPVSDGGSAVTGYTVTLQPGGGTCSTTVGVTSNPLTCTVMGLTNGTQYGVFVVARNVVGVGPGGSPIAYSIGDIGPGGGKVFYDAGAQQSWGRYLEAAPAAWGGAADPLSSWCDTAPGVVSSGSAIGSGAANTLALWSACASGAANIVTAYRGGGKSDWILPAKDELNALYDQRATVGGTTAWHYWTSTETSATTTWSQNFADGFQKSESINYSYDLGAAHLRPIRYIGEVAPAATVTPNDGLPLQIALSPSSIKARDYASVTLGWTVPSAWGFTISNHKVRVSADNGATWTETPTGSAAGSYRLIGLPYASARLVEVAAYDVNGWGSWSDPLLITTKGAQETRVYVTTAGGQPVSGGAITWVAVGARSAVTYGLTADGIIDFPAAPAGAVTVTLTGGQLPDGTLVSGVWSATLGFTTNVLKLPVAPTATHRVHVTLPGGLPVSNAQVSVTGLVSTFRTGGFTFTRPSGGISGFTDTSGVVTATGFPSGPAEATVVYNDGVIVQTPPAFDASAADSYLELEYSPFVQAVTSSGTANSGAAVSVVLSAVAPTPGGAGIRPAAVATRPQAGVAVTLLLPAGATKGTCGAKLTGRTAANGRVTLKVCATKSGVVRVKSAGAVAVGSFTLLVKGKPSLPPRSLSAKSKSVANAATSGSVSLSWAKPFFAGGALVTSYKVVLTAVGKPTVVKVLRVGARTPLKVTVTGLAHAKTYTVKLYAITKYGTSDAVVTTVPVA